MDDAQAGHIVEGKYELVKPLARGGMGTVWVGRHIHLGNPVAIKFLDTTVGDKQSMRIRFEREARAAANLKSPYIAQVHDYGVDGESPYLVMELLQGEDLNGRLKRVGRLSLAETRLFLEHVTKGLRRAHEAGIVHRDLKPGNLFISTVDDDEIMKILDFGIAKANDATEATKTGEIVGSPHYMSPEQLRADAALDYRSDLWSLGIIVYRCVTGKLPFPGEQITAVMMKIISEPVPPIADFDATLPPALDAFFQRALARSPAERFQSAREMLDAFTAVAVGEGVIASPATTGSRDRQDLRVSRPSGEVSGTSQVAVPLPSDPDPSSPSGTQVSQGAPAQPPNRARTLILSAAIALVVGALAVGAVIAHNSPSAPASAEPVATASAAHAAIEAPTAAPSHVVPAPDPTPTPAIAPTASASSSAPSHSAPVAAAFTPPPPRPQGGARPAPVPAPTPQPATPAPQAPAAPPPPKPPAPNGNTID